MTIPSTLSNILIEGNTIDAGYAGGGSPFTYTSLVTTSSDCRVFNNYFSGIQNSSPPTYSLMFIGNASCNIQGNTFIRSSNAIHSYISVIGSDDQIITGNIFDGYTVDGSSTINVSGLTSNSLYTNNKNQVGYAIIPLGTEKTATYGFTSGIITHAYPLYNWQNFDNTGSTNYTLNSLGVNDADVTSGFLYDNYVIKLFNSETSPTQQYFSIAIDITKSLPIGAKIIDAKISIFNPSSITLDYSGGSNNFSFALSASKNHSDVIDIQTHYSKGTTSWLLDHNATGSLIINSSGSEALLRSTYQIIEIPTLNFSGSLTDTSGTTTTVVNTNISSYYVVGNDSNIMARLHFFYKGSTTGGNTDPLILISPIVITYVF